MFSSGLLRIVGTLLLAAVIGAAVFFFSDAAQRAAAFELFFAQVTAAGILGPVLLGAVYVLACVLFIPGSILTLGAGFLFGIVTGTVTVSIASVVGASAAFLVGRTLARGMIEQRVAGNVRFQAIDRAVGKEGFKIVLLTRLSPIFPFNFLNYGFGLTKVSFANFFLASWIGMLPGTIMYVYLGSVAGSLAELVAGQTGPSAEKQMLLVVGLVATIVVTALVTRVASKALKEALPGPGVGSAAPSISAAGGATHGGQE
jgi:uncharacterized membrane protein YdjX (TVP38/TMEM64 family)